jgi:2-phosphosulfolactate phosphatase
MRIEVLLLPSQKPRLDSYDLVIIIDTLRATTVIVKVVEVGAMGIYPVKTITEAMRLKEIVPNALLAGERKAFKIKGFDLGNSPLEFTKENISGKNVILTTTNGTKVANIYQNYGKVVAMALSNVETVAHYSKNFQNLLLVCAGSHGEVSLEDSYTAGKFISFFDMVSLNDGGILAREISRSDPMKILKTSHHGRYLSSVGMEEDLEASLIERKAIPVLKTDMINLKFFGGER